MADGLTWEHVNCPSCRSDDAERVLDVPTDGEVFRVVRCLRCGLGYVNPRPDVASIARFYPEDYKPYQPRDEVRETWKSRLARRFLTLHRGHPGREGSTFERLALGLLRPLLAPNRTSSTSLPWVGTGRLLDFGCGSGWFLHRMKRLGWDVVGMDFSAHSARAAREAYGLEVHVGTLPHPAVRPESFDVVHMGSVLEHVHEPNALIAAAVEAIRPGGCLAVSVPNFESWTMRRFRAHCFHLDVPRHLLHFTPDVLGNLLTSHGLNVREIRMQPRTSWLMRTTTNVLADPTVGGGKKLVARLVGSPLLRGAIGRWTGWTGQADLFLALAQRPRRTGLVRVSA